MVIIFRSPNNSYHILFLKQKLCNVQHVVVLAAITIRDLLGTRLGSSICLILVYHKHMLICFNPVVD